MFQELGQGGVAAWRGLASFVRRPVVACPHRAGGAPREARPARPPGERTARRGAATTLTTRLAKRSPVYGREAAVPSSDPFFDPTANRDRAWRKPLWRRVGRSRRSPACAPLAPAVAAVAVIAAARRGRRNHDHHDHGAEKQVLPDTCRLSWWMPQVGLAAKRGKLVASHIVEMERQLWTAQSRSWRPQNDGDYSARQV